MQPFQIVLSVDENGNLAVNHPPNLNPIMAAGLLECAKTLVLAPLTSTASPIPASPSIVAAPADALNRINGSQPPNLRN